MKGSLHTSLSCPGRPERSRPAGVFASRAALLFVTSLSILVMAFVLPGCSRPEPDLIVSKIDPAGVIRGRALAEGLAACAFCHGQTSSVSSPLVGGNVFADKFGLVTAPNLTPSKSGIGEWNTNEILDGIRSAVNKDGEALSPEVHSGFEWMADEDALAIVSYLRALAPLDHSVERRSISLIDRNTTGFFDRTRFVKGFIPVVEPRFEVEYGKYLTNHVARCQSCHNSPGTAFTDESYLEGGKTILTSAGEAVAPGISPNHIDGLGSWSEKDILVFLKSGTTPEGNVIDSQFCPTEFFGRANESDLKAIARYLKSIAP